MIYIKIKEQVLPAVVRGRVMDMDWDKRESKTITLEMTYEEAMALFVDGAEWSIVYQEGEESAEYDNSAYEVAGPVTDNRDGTVTVKMGKITDGEILAELMEVLNET